MSDATRKALAELETKRQAMITKHGVDVRTLDRGDAYDVHREVRPVLWLELSRRRCVAAGTLPANC